MDPSANICRMSTPYISLYLMSGVPAVIGSDDPGILRGDISEEYVKLVQRYPFVSYNHVKEMVRNNIKYSFIKKPGKRRGLLMGLESRFDAFEAMIRRQTKP